MTFSHDFSRSYCAQQKCSIGRETLQQAQWTCVQYLQDWLVGIECQSESPSLDSSPLEPTKVAGRSTRSCMSRSSFSTSLIVFGAASMWFTLLPSLASRWRRWSWYSGIALAPDTAPERRVQAKPNISHCFIPSRHDCCEEILLVLLYATKETSEWRLMKRQDLPLDTDFDFELFSFAVTSLRLEFWHLAGLFSLWLVFFLDHADFKTLAAIPFTLFLLLSAIFLLFLILNQRLAPTSSECSAFVSNVPAGQKCKTSSLCLVYSTTPLPCDDCRLSWMWIMSSYGSEMSSVGVSGRQSYTESDRTAANINEKSHDVFVSGGNIMSTGATS